MNCRGGLDSLSGTTIYLCGNILLKSLKMHFSGNTDFFIFFFFWGGGGINSSNFFTGFRIHFFLSIDTLEIVKNHFSQKRK